MTKRIDRQADILSRRMERASVILPTIREHIDEQRRHTRTIGAASLDPGRQIGTHSDPTARAHLDLDHCDYLTRCIDDALASAEVAINLLDWHCRVALGYRAPDDEDPTKPRCIGDNSPEGDECWRVPSPRRNASGMEISDGRCTTCGFRYDHRKRAEADARRIRRHMNALGETA